MDFPFLRAVLPAAALSLIGCGGRTPPPNVLLVTIDTLRADRVGAYGYERGETPSLDGLAARGALFREAYAPVPYTLPCHASLLTGMLPSRHGVRDNGGRSLPKEATTLAEVLAARGYATAAFVGAFPLEKRFGLAQGFELYDDELGEPSGLHSIAERRGEEVVGRALDWLGSKPREPSFVWAHLFDPHAPYSPPEPFLSRFATRPYDGEVAYADRCVGRLLEGLGEFSARTLVVVTADHGESLGEHGEATHGLTLYEPAVRVPLLMAWPGRIRPGVRPAVRARLIDVFPTVCEAAGAPLPSGVEGESLLSALGSPGESTERPVYLETLVPLLHYGWAPLVGWRSGRWKFVLAPRPELYDLGADPGETRNLFEAAGEVAGRLRAQLLRAGRDSAEEALESAPRPLTEEERARFASIGYVWERSEAEAPGGKDVKDMLPLLRFLDAASVAIERGEFASAEAKIEEVLRADPENLLACRYGSDLEEARGDLPAAERACRKWLSLAPGDAEASARLGALLCRQERYAEAREILAPLARGADPSPGARAWYGVALQGLGERSEARAALTAALRADPRHRAALFALGRLAASEGKSGEAEDCLRRAIEGADERESARARLELASLLLEKGETEEERWAAREEAASHLEIVTRHFPRWKQALELRERIGPLSR